MNHFKANNVAVFTTFTMLGNPHFYLVPEYFHHTEINPEPIKKSLTLPPALANHQPGFCASGFASSGHFL